MRKSNENRKRRKCKLMTALLSGFLGMAVGRAGMTPMSYVAADTPETNGAITDGVWTYMLDEEDGTIKAEVTGYTGTPYMQQVDVPAEFGEYEVTRIGSDLFKSIDKKDVVYVVLPDTVEDIEELAFKDCSELKFVKMPSALRSIGREAFYNCTSLPRIGEKEEYDPKGDASGINIINDENAYISIGEYAFKGCTGLESVYLPDTVKVMHNYVFYGCTGLKTARLPKKLDSFGDKDRGFFDECTSLESVTLPENIKVISGFDNCKSLKSLVIPVGATTVAMECFKGCDNLETLVIPNTVTKMDILCLSDLKKVTVYAEPDSTGFLYANNDNNFYGKAVIPVKSATAMVNTDENGFKYMLHDSYAEIVGYEGTETDIEVPGFYDIPGEFYIPEKTISVTYIAGRVFKNKKLTSVKIPAGMEEIGEDAFYECSSLTGVEFDGDLDIIGDRAFYGCSSLTAVRFPSKITKIGSAAFEDCTLLKDVSFAQRDYTLTPDLEIGYEAFENCAITSIIIPKGVTDIAESLFENNQNLVSVSIPDGVTNISKSAFYMCGKLSSVTIPTTVTYIGDWAFSNCKSIKEIRIPDKVTAIDTNAFNNCENLEKAFIYKNVEKIAKTAFLNCPKLTIYTQSECVAAAYAEENNIPYVLVDKLPSGDDKTTEDTGATETSTEAPANNTTTEAGNNTTASNSTESTEAKTQEAQESSAPVVPKTSKVKVSSGKSGEIKLTWKKVKGASGYQIQYSLNRKYKNAETVKVSKKKVSKTLKKLESGKKYYVRIRAYKTYKGSDGKNKKSYGKWVAKKLKCK